MWPAQRLRASCRHAEDHMAASQLRNTSHCSHTDIQLHQHWGSTSVHELFAVTLFHVKRAPDCQRWVDANQDRAWKTCYALVRSSRPLRYFNRQRQSLHWQKRTEGRAGWAWRTESIPSPGHGGQKGQDHTNPVRQLASTWRRRRASLFHLLRVPSCQALLCNATTGTPAGSKQRE